MRRIEVTKRKIDRREWATRVPADSDIGTLLTEPCELWEGDRLVLAYIHAEERIGHLLDVFRRVRYGQRARTGGLVTTSKTFGWHPRVTLRRDFCTAAHFAAEQPVEHGIVCAAAIQVAEYYRVVNPTLYAEHAAQSAEKASRYRLRGTPFTSGIVNENNPLKYHLDSGNYPGVWSGMVAVRHRATGGHLCLPEYGVGLEVRHGSLTLFDGQGVVHGVTPIRLQDEESRRYTAVYYSLRGLWKCLPPEEELARIRRLRTEREGKPRKVTP